jgi:hypothetical protein
MFDMVLYHFTCAALALIFAKEIAVGNFTTLEQNLEL